MRMRLQIDEMYLLVHPFYNKGGDYWKDVCADFLKLWKESISISCQKETCYGILVKSAAPNVPKEFVDDLTRHFKRSFPWKRRSILRNLDGTVSGLVKPAMFWGMIMCIMFH